MKVKVTLRFRGREMAHQEYGMQVLDRLIRDIAPYGHPDAEPKLVGRGLNVMLSPLPRNKRAKNPHAEATELGDTMSPEEEPAPLRQIQVEQGLSDGSRTAKEQGSPSGFSNNPFEQLDSQLGPRSAA
jgi:translation initiation factor IF-3